MKKVLVFVSILVICAGSAFAIGAGIGARSIAMGGTGIATATDITSAYFNPAGLMFGAENFDCQLLGGGATAGIADIADIFGASNTENMLNTLLPKDFNVNASLNGGLGCSIKKVGISALMLGNMNFEKKADQLDMNINAQVNGVVPLTLGSTFATPGLPIASMSVGVNLKSIYDIWTATELVSADGVAKGSSYFANGTGFGFDIGAMAKVTPLVTVGGVIRNLSASETFSTTTKTLTATIDGTGNLKLDEGTEEDSKTTYTPPTEVGIGVSVLVPLTGTLIACDIENYSYADKGNNNKSVSTTDTHIGFEQGVLLNTVMLRAGYFTYGVQNDTFYTWGLGFNAGPANFGFAAANSVKDCKGSIASMQAGISF